MRTLVIVFLAAITLTTASPASFAEDALREKLRDTIFDTTNEALVQANQANANVLAPKAYLAAGNELRKAESAFDSGADLTRVRAMLATATGLLIQAQTSAQSAAETLKAPFQARQDALSVEAKTHAPDLWQEAEVQLYEAATRLEAGRSSRVARYAERAESKFREAELIAIEVALFSEIETAIARAKKLDADDWAPQSYTYAVDLLNQARSELSANRYDTDRPRNLATQSLHFARHAAYVAKLADDIDDNDDSLEAILLLWEADIRRLADLLNTPVYFDAGPTDAIDQLIGQTQNINAKLADTEQQLRNSRNRAEILAEELSLLQADLQGQELAQQRLNKRLAEQQAREDNLRKVENLFSPVEAIVLRTNNQLIIRLIGLGFSSGSAQIETHHYPVLAKLQQALEIFPEAPITIEGHTDSHGVDDRNLQLSVDRAEAVVGYLLANTSIAPLKLSAVGYGEAQPIANNETDEGRLRNRRIDVVVYP